MKSRDAENSVFGLFQMVLLKRLIPESVQNLKLCRTPLRQKKTFERSRYGCTRSIAA
jgi:hypothetical protein